LHEVIVNKDLKAAEKQLLSLPGLKRYKKSLRSRAEQENFLGHLRKYIEMYQTDCAWEVSTTNRYTITTYEAAVTARRRIRQGDKIKYLIGTLVPLTTEESADLDMTNRNFSIVVSARKKNSSIFLGPARFANHDCDANGRLVTSGESGMEVVAMKNIEVGDEITVSYGDDYFGPDNVDCLCHTCERYERNGWTSRSVACEPSSRPPTPASDTPQPLQPTNLKRKRDSETVPSSSAPPPAKYAKVVSSPSKLNQSWTPPDSSDSENSERAAVTRRSEPPKTSKVLLPVVKATLSPPDSQTQPNTSESPDPLHLDGETCGAFEVSQQAEPIESVIEDEPTQTDEPAIQPPIPTALLQPSLEDDNSVTESNIHDKKGPTISEVPVEIKIESVETRKLEVDEDTILVAPAREPASDHNAPAAVSRLTTTQLTKKFSGRSSSTCSSMETNVLPSIETATTTVAKLSVVPAVRQIRIAGDYILTRKLLAQPHDRWVHCHNERCGDFFIQPNGYQTRRECPRCERHSMLYGFPWPKTDADPRKVLERKSLGGNKGKKSDFTAYRRQGKSGKGSWVEGGGDPEERVMDHRTIHRFVNPDEERDITRKGLLKEAEDARAAGDKALAMLEAKMRASSNARALNHGTDSRETSQKGSATPDDLRRRSNRFVTDPVGVYKDRF
jgi:[histone H4]-N-methyl-L-lysine20 N-methyltransferase